MKLMHTLDSWGTIGCRQCEPPTRADQPAAVQAQGITTANAIAARLVMDEMHAGVMPADKLVLVENLQREGRIVAMASDGINDGPAVARLTCGWRWAPAPAPTSR